MEEVKLPEGPNTVVIYSSLSNTPGRAARRILKLEERYRLRIAKLNADKERKIKKLRSRCAHHFKNTRGVRLLESLVPNVYFLRGESRRSAGPEEFVTTCAHCGELRIESCKKTCMACLSPLSEPEKDIDRAKYFGNKHLYYSVMVAQCASCKNGFVWDVWDQ